MIEKNKITLIVLILIIAPLVAYIQVNGLIDLNKIGGYLIIPFFIIGIILVILLNLPRVQNRMKEVGAANPQKDVLFLDPDEEIINTRLRMVFRISYGFIPMIYLFSKVTVTNKRVQFAIIPFLTTPSMSLFYAERKHSFPYMPSLVSVTKNKKSLSLRTSTNEYIWISFRDLENLGPVVSTVKNALRGNVS